MSADSSAVTELQDIDVHEVSLVDAPAIRRKFLIIKREDSMSDTTNDSTTAEPEVDATPAADATTADVSKDEEATAAPVEEQTAADAPEDVAKADAVEPDETVEADVTKADDETAAEESVQVEDVEKAKRMTAARMARLDQMYKELGALLKELLPQGQPNDGGVPNTPPVTQYPASQIVKAEDIEAIVKKSLDEALKPLLEAIAPAAPAEVQKSEDVADAASTDDDAAQAADANEAEVADLRKRLSELEATSSAGTANNTDTITKTTSIWAGIV